MGTVKLAIVPVLGAVGLLLAGGMLGDGHAQSVTPSAQEVIEYTAEWEGERYDSGRPKVSDEILSSRSL